MATTDVLLFSFPRDLEGAQKQYEELLEKIRVFAEKEKDHKVLEALREGDDEATWCALFGYVGTREADNAFGEMYARRHCANHYELQKYVEKARQVQTVRAFFEEFEVLDTLIDLFFRRVA